MAAHRTRGSQVGTAGTRRPRFVMHDGCLSAREGGSTARAVPSRIGGHPRPTALSVDGGFGTARMSMLRLATHPGQWPQHDALVIGWGLPETLDDRPRDRTRGILLDEMPGIWQLDEHVIGERLPHPRNAAARSEREILHPPDQ